jgi:hypothetical protein
MGSPFLAGERPLINEKGVALDSCAKHQYSEFELKKSGGHSSVQSAAGLPTSGVFVCAVVLGHGLSLSFKVEDLPFALIARWRFG